MDLKWLPWSSMLAVAENELADDLSNLDVVFKNVPLEIFGELMLEVPDSYQRMKRLLPRMPSEEIQRSWAGDAGIPLLYKGTSFVRASLKYFRYQDIRPRGLRALDFGCGWGRLLRLYYKYFPLAQLEGVDPWDESINSCRDCGLANPLAISEYLPQSLPTTTSRFDLIYAFSVFTHLSARVFAACLGTLRRYISHDGVLIITLRPAEYWLQVGQPEHYERHRRDGFCFVPHPFRQVDGEWVYGDTSCDLAYLTRFDDWRVEDVDVSYTDPYQIFVSLRPKPGDGHP